MRSRFTLSLPHPKGTRTQIRRISSRDLPPATREAAKALGLDPDRLRITEKITTPATVYEVRVDQSKTLYFTPAGKPLDGPLEGGAGGRIQPGAKAAPAKGGKDVQDQEVF